MWKQININYIILFLKIAETLLTVWIKDLCKCAEVVSLFSNLWPLLFRSGWGERTTHLWHKCGEPHVAEHGLGPGDGPGSRGKGHHRANPGHTETQRHRSGFQLNVLFLTLKQDETRRFNRSKVWCRWNTAQAREQYNGPEKFIIRREGARFVLATRDSFPYWGNYKKPGISSQTACTKWKNDLTPACGVKKVHFGENDRMTLMPHC